MRNAVIHQTHQKYYHIQKPIFLLSRNHSQSKMHSINLTCQLNPLDLHCSANSTSSADHTLPAEQNIAEHPRAISIIKMKNKERQRPKKPSIQSSSLLSSVFAHFHSN